MRFFTKTIFIITLISISVSSFAQMSNKEKIYSSYNCGDYSIWKTTIDQMQQKNNKSTNFIFELINYQYGYIALSLGLDNDDDAEKYLALAEENLYELENNRKINSSVLYSYKSALNSFHISLAPLKAMSRASKSKEYVNKALELNPNSFFANIQMGNYLYYLPKTLGGSKQDAITYYLKAENLISNKQNLIENNWNYINLILIIAQTYEKIEDYENADIYYQKLFVVAPNFLALGNNIYPKFLENRK